MKTPKVKPATTDAAKAGADNAEDAAKKPITFVLTKNHGLIHNGRASQFYEAGTEFDGETDADVIAQLSKSGAQLEQQ